MLIVLIYSIKKDAAHYWPHWPFPIFICDSYRAHPRQYKINKHEGNTFSMKSST